MEERARRRLTMAVAASVLGLVIVGGGGWAWLARQRQERAERFSLAYHETEALNRQAETAGDDLRAGSRQETPLAPPSVCCPTPRTMPPDPAARASSRP